MTYIPGHSAIVAYAVESAAAPVIPDGSAPTLANPSSSPTYLGYTNIPQTNRNFNNAMGYGLGQADAAYRKRSRVEVDLNFTLRPGKGAFEFVKNYLLRGNAEDDFWPIAIYVGQIGQSCDVYRFCKCQQAQFNFADPGGGGEGELTIQPTFWGITKQYGGGPVLNPSTATLRAFETPLMYHDVRQFQIQDSISGSWTDYRAALMSHQVTVSHNLERKNCTPNYGDNNPLSRVSYDILPHLINVSGQIQLHNSLSKDRYDAAVTSQDWGDLATLATNTGVQSAGETAKYYLLTARDCMPTSESTDGVEASAELQFSVNYVARNLDITLS